MAIPLTRRAGTVVVVIVAAVASLTGCGGGGGAGASAFAPSTSVLATALRQVQDNAATRAVVQFGRPAAALAANGGKLAGGPYATAVGYGLGPLMNVLAESPKDVLGFDPVHASYAITAGLPPHTGTLLSGLRLNGAPAKLRALGARSADSTTRSGSAFRFAPDDQLDFHGRLAAALPGLVASFNVVELDHSNLRFGADSASLNQMQLASFAQTEAAGEGLMRYQPMAEVASCLNDPLAAAITNKLPADNESLPPAAQRQPTSGVRMVGVGLSGSAGAPPTELMCVNEDSVQHADQLAAAVRTALHSGMSLEAHSPWHTLLTAASVRVERTTVSLTAHSGRGAAGVLLNALNYGDLPGVIG